MEFHELGTWKDLAGKFFFNSDLLKSIVMPTLDDTNYEEDDNWFGGKNLPTQVNGVTEYHNLVGHYFDVPFIYSTVTDERMVLCVDTEVSKWVGQAIKEITITIYVICHKDFIKMSSDMKSEYITKHKLAGNRVDMAVEVIGRLLNGSNAFGLGRLVPAQDNTVLSYFPNSEFYGKVLRYTCDDFSTDYAGRSINGD